MRGSRTGDAIDMTRPAVSRVRDHWLGGCGSFAADRIEAARLEDAYPPGDGVPAPRRMAACGRRFTERAVAWAAGRGVAQFAHLGAGWPVPSPYTPLHVIAPGARVAYVEDDPVALTYLAASADGVPGASAVEGDFTRPGDVLDELKRREAVDVTRPWCAILVMAPAFMEAGQARDVCAAYASAMVPGSCLVVATPRWDDPATWERIQGACTVGDVRNHPAGDVVSFFGDLEVVPPGVVPAGAWQPCRPAALEPDSAAYVLAGVGIFL